MIEEQFAAATVHIVEGFQWSLVYCDGYVVKIDHDRWNTWSPISGLYLLRRQTSPLTWSHFSPQNLCANTVQKGGILSQTWQALFTEKHFYAISSRFLDCTMSGVPTIASSIRTAIYIFEKWIIIKVNNNKFRYQINLCWAAWRGFHVCVNKVRSWAVEP